MLRDYILGVLLGAGIVLALVGSLTALLAARYETLLSTMNSSTLSSIDSLAALVEEVNTTRLLALYKSVYNETGVLVKLVERYEEVYKRLPRYKEELGSIESIVESPEYDEIVSLMKMLSSAPIPGAEKLAVVVRLAKEAKRLIPELLELLDEVEKIKPSMLWEGVSVLKEFEERVPPDRLAEILAHVKTLASRAKLLEREYLEVRDALPRLEILGLAAAGAGAALASFSLVYYARVGRREAS